MRVAVAKARSGLCNGTETCFVDADGDGYRRDDVSQVLSEDTDCFDDGEAEATDPGGDCDDDDPTLNPGAEDVPEDGVDQARPEG